MPTNSTNPDLLLGEPLTADAILAPRGSVPPGRDRRVARLRQLWTERRLIGKITLAGSVLIALITLLIPNRYTSTARIMPPDDTSGSTAAALSALLPSGSGGGGSSGLGAIAGQVLGMKSSSDVYLGILQSRTTQDKLINDFDLKKIYGDRKIEDARLDLASHSDISVDRKSLIITVAVTDKDKYRAAKMAQAYADSLDTLLNQLSTSGARRERIFLEGRLAQVQHDLETAENQFSQFASKNATISISEQGKAMVESVAAVEGQMVATQAELDSLKQIYSDQNVRVRAMTARLNELKLELQKLGGSSEDASSSGTSTGDSLYPSLRKLPLLGVTYADLYRQTALQEAIYETLTKEYELAKVQEAKEIPTVKILDSPNIPESKSFPPRMVITILGLVLSFSAGLAWVWAKARWAEIQEGDPGKVLLLEILEALPQRTGNGHRNGANGDGGGAGSSGTPPLLQSDKD